MDNPSPAQNMELPKKPEGLTEETARELVRAALAGEKIEDRTQALSQETPKTPSNSTPLDQQNLPTETYKGQHAKIAEKLAEVYDIQYRLEAVRRNPSMPSSQTGYNLAA